MAADSPATMASLVPGYEFRRSRRVPRFAPRPAGGAPQRLKVPRKYPEDTRPYQAGDPVHMIDWRAYGRTDQLLVRQQRDPAPVPVCIQLNLRDSMYWDKAKAEVGWRIALFCAFGLLRRGDLVEIDVAGRTSRFPGARSAIDLFHLLTATGFGPDAGSGILPAIAQPSRAARRIVISDDLAGRGLASDFSGLSPADLMIHLLSARETGDDWRTADAVYSEEERDPREWEEDWLMERMNPARKAWFAQLDTAADKAGVMCIRLTPDTLVDDFVSLFERWCAR